MSLSFVLVGHQIKRFRTALRALAAIGSELLVEGVPEQLVLRCINSARSAFLAVTLSAGFFESYNVFGGTGLVQAGVLLKHVLATFRSPRVSSVVFDLNAAEAALRVTLKCDNGLVKRYGLDTTASDILQANLDGQDLPVSVVAEAGELNKLLNAFQSTLDEVTIIALPEQQPAAGSAAAAAAAQRAVKIQSFYDPAKGAGGRSLHTSLSLDSHSVFRSYCHSGSSPSDVTINLRDLKALVGLCAEMGADVRLQFDAPGVPLLATPHARGAHQSSMDCTAELILATLQESQVQQDGSWATRQPNQQQQQQQQSPAANGAHAAAARGGDRPETIAAATTFAGGGAGAAAPAGGDVTPQGGSGGGGIRFAAGAQQAQRGGGIRFAAGAQQAQRGGGAAGGSSGASARQSRGSALSRLQRLEAEEAADRAAAGRPGPYSRLPQASGASGGGGLAHAGAGASSGGGGAALTSAAESRQPHQPQQQQQQPVFGGFVQPPPPQQQRQQSASAVGSRSLGEFAAVAAAAAQAGFADPRAPAAAGGGGGALGDSQGDDPETLPGLRQDVRHTYYQLSLQQQQVSGLQDHHHHHQQQQHVSAGGGAFAGGDESEELPQTPPDEEMQGGDGERFGFL